MNGFYALIENSKLIGPTNTVEYECDKYKFDCIIPKG